MKKTSLLNIVAAILTIVIAVSSVLYIGNSREWFSKAKKDEGPRITASFVDGSVSVIRRGAGYILKEGIGLTAGDEIITASSASAVIDLLGSADLVMDEESEIVLQSFADDKLEIEVKSGSCYISIGEFEQPFVIKTKWGSVTTEKNSSLSIEMRHGTQTLRIYRGNAFVETIDPDKSADISEGRQYVVLQDEDGNNQFLEPEDISPRSMSDFLLEKTLEEDNALFFSKEELKAESERRIKEVEDARKAREEYEKELIARGGTVPVVVIPQGGNPGSYSYSCTVTIRCDTILSHMSDLAAGKEAYVPANGVILASIRVQFSEGESVYDVLKRVCSYANIPIQYSYTVAYGGYYIEGINNICEFDCGPQSGWMYKVNGWFPNYGSMYYALSDGDDIVWAYSCEGLGEDIGAVFSY